MPSALNAAEEIRWPDSRSAESPLVSSVRLTDRAKASYTPTASNERLWSRSKKNIGGGIGPRFPGLLGGAIVIVTSRSASGKGNGRRSPAFTKLNINVFTPMPSASDVIAIAVNPGVLTRRRHASPTSRTSISTPVMRRISIPSRASQNVSDAGRAKQLLCQGGRAVYDSAADPEPVHAADRFVRSRTPSVRFRDEVRPGSDAKTRRGW